MSPQEDIKSLIDKLLSSYPFRIVGQWYLNQPILLDGYSFVKCRFDRCKIFTSKGSFVIDQCFFSECSFFYQNEAGKVVKLYNIIATEAKTKWPGLVPKVNEDGTISILHS